MHVDLLDTLGAGGPICRNQRMMQRKRHGTVRCIQLCGQVQDDRSGGEDVRLRSGNMQIAHRGLYSDLTGVADDVSVQAADSGTSGVEQRDLDRAVRVRLGKGSVHLGIDRYGLPRHARSRRHGRSLGLHRHIRGLMVQVHGAGSRSSERAGGDADLRGQCIPRTIDRSLDLNRTEIGKVGEARNQPFGRFLGPDRGSNIS